MKKVGVQMFSKTQQWILINADELGTLSKRGNSMNQLHI